MRITGHYPELLEEALAIVSEHANIPAVIEYEDGTTRNARLCRSSEGALMRLNRRSRRYGVALWRECKPIAAITLKLPKASTITPAQLYTDDLRRLRRYFHKNSDPRLWADYRAEVDTITDEALAELEKADCASRYEAWKLAGKLGLPQIEPFKSTTLRTCEAPDYVMEAVRNKLGREKFSYAWRGRYDYSVSGRLCEDGVWRAWLSAEYKGCGNGHYYLLISAERAVFNADD